MMMTGHTKVYVIARSLDNGEPKTKLEVELLAVSGRILNRQAVDANGVAVFDRRFFRGSGANAFAVAAAYSQDEATNDRSTFTFLEANAPYLDISDIDSGRPAASGPLDVYVATDRGIYQPGDRINAVILPRNLEGALPDEEITFLVSLDSDAGVSIVSDTWPSTGGMSRISVPKNSTHWASFANSFFRPIGCCEEITRNSPHTTKSRLREVCRGLGCY